MLPKDWSLAKLRNVCKVLPTIGKKIKQKEYLCKGTIPIIDQGRSLIGGYSNDKKLILDCELPVILFGDHTKIIKYVDFKFVLGADGVKVLKPCNLYNPKLFFYYLTAIKIPDKGYARHFQYLIKENIPLPPLPVQHKIVSKIEELFSELDKGIENLRKAKEQIKTYRQAVLAAAFSGKLTGELRVENSELRIGENDPLLVRQMLKAAEPRVEYGKDSLPEGWKWVKLGEHIESMKNGLYKPAEYYSDNGIPCLRMYNIQNGKIEWYDIKRMIITEEELEEYKLLEDDLLVNRVNSRELVGKTARILKSMELSVYESKNIRVRLMPSLSSSYVNYWFIFYGNKYFDKNTQQTVGMASINQSQIANMEIPITDLSKQNEVVSEIEWRFSVADKLEQTIDENLKKADLLKQSILKQAFEGKLV